MPRPPRDFPDEPIDIDPGPINVPFDPPEIFVPTTNLHFLSLASFDGVLPDGDRINLVVEGADLPGDRVQLRLRTQAGMWFKGVEGSNGMKLESDGGAITGGHMVTAGELGGLVIILVKAKLLGVHTAMYELPGRAIRPLLGKRIIFDWMSD